MDQHNHFFSIIAIFLALGIGILIGASMGENALITNQIAIIDELREELTQKDDKIDGITAEITKLEEEIYKWQKIEKDFITPLLIEEKLKGYEVVLISEKKTPEGLIEFFQISGCSYHELKLRNGKDELEQEFFYIQELADKRQEELEDFLSLFCREINEVVQGVKTVSDTTILDDLINRNQLDYKHQELTGNSDEISAYLFIVKGDSYIMQSIAEIMLNYSDNVFWIDHPEKIDEEIKPATLPSSIMGKNGVDTLWERLNFISYLSDAK